MEAQGRVAAVEETQVIAEVSQLADARRLGWGPTFTCGECKTSNIQMVIPVFGTRYHCNDCSNGRDVSFDICSTCWDQHIHALAHCWVRYSQQDLRKRAPSTGNDPRPPAPAAGAAAAALIVDGGSLTNGGCPVPAADRRAAEDYRGAAAAQQPTASRDTPADSRTQQQHHRRRRPRRLPSTPNGLRPSPPKGKKPAKTRPVAVQHGYSPSSPKSLRREERLAAGDPSPPAAAAAAAAAPAREQVERRARGVRLRDQPEHHAGFHDNLAQQPGAAALHERLPSRAVAAAGPGDTAAAHELVQPRQQQPQAARQPAPPGQLANQLGRMMDDLQVTERKFKNNPFFQAVIARGSPQHTAAGAGGAAARRPSGGSAAQPTARSKKKASPTKQSAAAPLEKRPGMTMLESILAASSDDDGEEEEDDTKLCVICLEAPKCVCLVPCGHVCLCEDCSRDPHVSLCPICRQPIVHRQKVFL